MIPMEQSVDRWVLGFAYVGATVVCIGLVVAAWAAWDHVCERLGMKREELRRAVAEMRQNEREAFKAIGRWRPTGMDLVSEIDEMVNTLQAQAKENEELREHLASMASAAFQLLNGFPGAAEKVTQAAAAAGITLEGT